MKRTIRLLKNNLLSIKTEISIDKSLIRELEPGCLSLKWAKSRLRKNIQLHDEFKIDIEIIRNFTKKQSDEAKINNDTPAN